MTRRELTERAAKGDSETVSEKPRRGRPKAEHTLEIDEWRRGGLCEQTTVRGRQNQALALRAWEALRDAWEPTFAWFWRHAPVESYEQVSNTVMATGGRDLRWTVLTELGRIPFGPVFLQAARDVASMPPRTTCRAAVARTRQLHEQAAVRAIAAHRAADRTAVEGEGRPNVSPGHGQTKSAAGEG
jgi:hypothetical protein